MKVTWTKPSPKYYQLQVNLPTGDTWISGKHSRRMDCVDDWSKQKRGSLR